MKLLQIKKSHALPLILILLVSSLLVSCKELSNDPPNTPVLSLDIKDIQQQLGMLPPSSSEGGPSFATINAPTNIETLALGALNIPASRGSTYLYTSSSSLTGDQIESDVMASYSAGYIKFVQRADFQGKEYVEFNYPNSGQSRWQVVVVAFTKKVDSIDSAKNAFVSGSSSPVSHGGFSTSAYTASSITADTVIEITMHAEAE